MSGPGTGTDRIVKQLDLPARPERVWRALTDSEEFGRWFRAAFAGPFVLGRTTTGRSTYPGYEHCRMDLHIEALEPIRRFAFSGSPDAVEDAASAAGPTTLVEFLLEPIPAGTRLTITESGFDAFPRERAEELRLGNEQGWQLQAANLTEYLRSNR